MGDSLPGLQARLMSQALRKLTASISRSNCMVIFINQIRMKIGVMFGSPETTTGWQCAEVLCLGAARYPPHRFGQGPRTRWSETRPASRWSKNKMAPAVQAGRVRHQCSGEGCLQGGRTGRSGRQGGDRREIRRMVLLYNSQRLGQGRENAKQFLREKPGSGRRDRIVAQAERRADCREVPRNRSFARRG